MTMKNPSGPARLTADIGQSPRKARSAIPESTKGGVASDTEPAAMTLPQSIAKLFEVVIMIPTNPRGPLVAEIAVACDKRRREFVVCNAASCSTNSRLDFGSGATLPH
jgi:hypothetical protein